MPSRLRLVRGPFAFLIAVGALAALVIVSSLAALKYSAAPFVYIDLVLAIVLLAAVALNLQRGQTELSGCHPARLAGLNRRQPLLIVQCSMRNETVCT